MHFIIIRTLVLIFKPTAEEVPHVRCEPPRVIARISGECTKTILHYVTIAYPDIFIPPTTSGFPLGKLT